VFETNDVVIVVQVSGGRVYHVFDQILASNQVLAPSGTLSIFVRDQVDRLNDLAWIWLLQVLLIFCIRV
jgi:hypothetical protein